VSGSSHIVRVEVQSVDAIDDYLMQGLHPLRTVVFITFKCVGANVRYAFVKLFQSFQWQVKVSFPGVSVYF
jgi:hypothetical protein